MASGKVTAVWDDSELKTLAINLEEAPGRIQRSAPKVLGKASDLIKTEMKRDARGHRYLPRFPRSVQSTRLSRWEAEIGYAPIPGTQGKLAHIILLGSINNIPVYDYRNGARRATPRILEMFLQDTRDAVLRAKP